MADISVEEVLKKLSLPQKIDLLAGPYASTILVYDIVSMLIPDYRRRLLAY